jgi:hypothetical protein
MGIDDESSHPELCSEVAGSVTRTIVCLFREPDAGNLPVRFDEREQETEPCQTGLRRALRKQCLRMPPGDYRYCACSRLHSRFHSLTLKMANRRRKLVLTGCNSYYLRPARHARQSRQAPWYRIAPTVRLAWIIHEVSSQKRKDALKGMMNTGFARPAFPFGASIA